MEDDQDSMKERLIPENDDNKLIEVIPVHDNNNDLTPSKWVSAIENYIAFKG